MQNLSILVLTIASVACSAPAFALEVSCPVEYFGTEKIRIEEKTLSEGLSLPVWTSKTYSRDGEEWRLTSGIANKTISLKSSQLESTEYFLANPMEHLSMKLRIVESTGEIRLDFFNQVTICTTI